MHDPELVHSIRHVAWTASLYGRSAARVLLNARSLPRPRREERLIFVVGAPRSGTTFLAGSIGAADGVVDLGEVKPLKAAIPRLAETTKTQAAVAIRRIVDRVRKLGLSAHLRGVEQTPETAFVLDAALVAYPQARAVHVVRDGRDVAASLLERGWLSSASRGVDEGGTAYGARARFWVEPERAPEFESGSEAVRAAWAWRRYVTAARRVPERTLELRYEQLVADPDGVAEQLAAHLDLDPAPIRRALGRAHSHSEERWRHDLEPQQLEDVEREAGALLRELGYL